MDVTQPGSELRDGLQGGGDGVITMKVEAVEADVFEPCVQMRQ